MAEREAYLTGVQKQLNFVVVGGGPTGVELAGAIAGIARQALAKDFMAIDTRKASVMLFEGSDRVLGTFAKEHHFILFVLEEDLPLFSFAKSAMQLVPVAEKFRPPLKNILWHQRQLPALIRQH